jgi:hypothetical protein
MTPDIYFYNPTCEIAVANGSENFMPKSLLRRMEYDLDLLPAFFALPKDVILVQKYPCSRFLDSLTEAGLPPFKLRQLDESLNDSAFLSEPKGFLNPWGWSPAMHKLFAPLKPSCSSEYLNSPMAQWDPVHKELYSRKAGSELLSNILTNSNYTFFTPLDEMPQICTSHEEIYALQQKWNHVIVKAPWSSSGRGLQVLRPGEYNRTNYQVISGFLSHQGYVMAEPYYNKVQDLSFQFYSKGNGQIEFLGIGSFKTDKSGRYSGSYIEEIPQYVELSLKDFLIDHLDETKKCLERALQNSPYSLQYQGWLGVDSIVYKSEKNAFMIQPCIEVNCRYTMGTISLAFRKRLAEGSRGFLSIIYRKEGELQQYFTEQKLRNPLIIEENKVVKGFLSLTPVADDTVFGAYLVVDQE